MKFFDTMESPIGLLYIAEDSGYITDISIHTIEDAVKKRTAVIEQAAAQLAEYFSGKRTGFDLPISPNGTVFQHKVWDEMNKIPYGCTASYSQLLGAKYSRAAGGAANKNPVLIVQPCHRVIGKNGKLTGFAIDLEIKEFLLQLEKNNTPPYH